MAGIHDEHEFVSQDRERIKVAIDRLESHHSEIHIAVQDFPGQMLRNMPEDFNPHVWVEFSVSKNEVRQKVE